MIGYKWHAEHDAVSALAEEQREWIRRCEALHGCADRDGIVCIPSVRGEQPAWERLLRLLSIAFAR